MVCEWRSGQSIRGRRRPVIDSNRCPSIDALPPDLIVGERHKGIRCAHRNGVRDHAGDDTPTLNTIVAKVYPVANDIKPYAGSTLRVACD